MDFAAEAEKIVGARNTAYAHDWDGNLRTLIEQLAMRAFVAGMRMERVYRRKRKRLSEQHGCVTDNSRATPACDICQMLVKLDADFIEARKLLRDINDGGQ